MPIKTAPRGHPTLVSFDWAMKSILRDKANFDIIQNSIDEWVYFFKNSEIKDEFHSKNIQQARAKLDVLKMDETERRAYEAFLAARAAQDDILQTARREGKAEVALAMLQERLSPSLILKMTGLSEAEINALAKTRDA